MDKDRQREIGWLLHGNGFPPRKEALIETLGDLAAENLIDARGGYDGAVLLIYGRLDKITPAGGQRLWKDVFRDLEEHPVDGAGHAPHLTRSREAARVIRDFILKSG